MALVGCSSTGAAASLPRDASALSVVDAYLTDVASKDCGSAQHVAAATFTRSNGDICGAVKLTAYSVDAEPRSSSPGNVVFTAHITVRGGSASGFSSGRTLWFLSLERQDGQWKLTGGGSGP
ncbi:MAG: hypothetical protein ACTHQ3_07645 [Motilibacteraceae bacterium]